METNELQAKVRDFVNLNNINASIEIRILDLCSELGELCKEVLKGNNYGKGKLVLGGKFHEEFGDTMFSLMCIANSAGIDIESTIEEVLKKYESRLKSKGDISSEG